MMKIFLNCQDIKIPRHCEERSDAAIQKNRNTFSITWTASLALAMTVLMFTPIKSHAAEKESAYDRVIASNTLRCGYWNWQPLYWKDDKSGETKGIFYDVMSEISRIGDLKIEWTQEVQFANLITDLKSGRIDAVCAGAWPSAGRAKQILFTEPVFYIPINAYVKTGNTRFDKDTGRINAADVKIAVMDGEMSKEIKASDFSKAQSVEIPQIAGNGGELLMQVSTGKADVTFTDSVAGNAFMKANPESVKPALIGPLRVMPNTIAVDDIRLKLFLDEAIKQLHNSGTIEKILKKYDGQFPGSLIRVSKSYGVAK